jgi:hypothetical protein
MSDPNPSRMNSGAPAVGREGKKTLQMEEMVREGSKPTQLVNLEQT